MCENAELRLFGPEILDACCGSKTVFVKGARKNGIK